jgi:hypothetical protein
MPAKRPLTSWLDDTNTNSLNLATTTIDSTLEYLKEQQNQLQRQLLKQEMLNSNLYQSLLNSGILQNGNQLKGAVSSVTTSYDFNESVNNGLATAAVTTVAAASTANQISRNFPSMLPIEDMIGNLSSVFNTLFGTKFWIYALVAIIVVVVLTSLTCMFVYCCCCSNPCRNILCCCKSPFSFNRKSKSSRKKKKMIDDDDNSSRCKKLCLCV